MQNQYSYHIFTSKIVQKGMHVSSSDEEPQARFPKMDPEERITFQSKLKQALKTFVSDDRLACSSTGIGDNLTPKALMEKYKARANDHRVKKDKSDNKKQSGEKMFGVCYALIVHGRVPRARMYSNQSLFALRCFRILARCLMLYKLLVRTQTKTYTTW